jgi:hypothetical protein
MKKAKDAAVQYQTTVTRPSRSRTAITLESSLADQLRQAAEWNGITLEEATDTAMMDYYYRYAFAKIEKERTIFEQRKPELLKRYRGQYIAMHNGDVVAHAKDLNSLHKQVFDKYGRTPILHKQVLPDPDRDYVIRSPRLVRS